MASRNPKIPLLVSVYCLIQTLSFIQILAQCDHLLLEQLRNFTAYANGSAVMNISCVSSGLNSTAYVVTSASEAQATDIAVTGVVSLNTGVNSAYDFDDITNIVSAEKKLIRELMDRYSKIGIVGRPVHNTTQTINVEYGIGLIQILDLDEKNQILTTNVWCRYVSGKRPRDYSEDIALGLNILLRWNPQKYGGVSVVRVPADEIWKPDIVLYNYADERLREHRDAMAVVENNGKVMWIPPAIFKSSCSIDITHFPFDEQYCFLKFGSWTYDGFQLDINFFDQLQEMDLNDYMKSHEWDVLDHPAERNEKKYPCCKEPYPDLTFRLRLRRKVAFYNYILILPCVLLSTLTLVLFWLPPESPAKMVLGMNIFVAFFVLLLLLAESTPPAASSIPLIGMNIFVAFFLLLLLLAESTPPAASKIPLIGAYYCLNMILITLSTFLSVIVINLYFRGDRKNKVPVIIKRIVIDGMARVLCMSSELQSHEKEKEKLRTIWDAAAPGAGLAMSIGGYHSQSSQMRTMKFNKFRMTEIHTDRTQPTASMSTPSSVTPRRSIVPPNRSTTYPPLNGSCLPPKRTWDSTIDTPPDAASPDRSPIQFPMSLNADIKEIRRYMRIMVRKFQDREITQRIMMEWRLVALVLDRIFFFMYLAAIIISLVTIFPKTTSPNNRMDD